MAIEANELINDSRLTPTMERVRSGKIQLFRERNPNDRTFISDENCDVKLEHSEKQMYAELIDGNWYWVNGCGACKGEERSWKTYIECKKHDVCRCCQKSRSEINCNAWGGSNGWICEKCKDKERLQAKRSAIKKLNGKKPDTTYLSKIICPNCGTDLTKCDVHESQDIECDVCNTEIKLEIEYTPIYSTYLKPKIK